MNRLQRISPRRLRWLLGLLFVALALPSAVLVVQTRRQLELESFHQHRRLAAELAGRIDQRLQQLVAAEDARSVAEFAFLTVAGVPGRSSLLQRSPLAQFPVRSEVPGLLGWFQIDAGGRFSTPWLPDAATVSQSGLGRGELQSRQAAHDQLLDVLGRNRLVERRRSTELPRSDAEHVERMPAPQRPNDTPGPVASPPAAQAMEERTVVVAPAASPMTERDPRSSGQPPPPPPPAAMPAPAAQLGFDRLNAAGAQERTSEKAKPASLADSADEPAARPTEPAPARLRRQEQAASPTSLDDAAPLTIFDSEVDPFEFARLESGHFVLFRRIWRNGERSIQGALIEQQAFVRGALAEPFLASLLAPVSDLTVLWQGQPLQQIAGRPLPRYDGRADALRGDLLHRERLSAPLADVDLLWTVRALPTSPGASLVAWAGLLLFGVLIAGFATLYRLGMRQLRLARQQQDFIAAVSHELKTPLTSIRMYGELLRAGWAPEERRREYYDYIHDESERLSRLIANVLQLARLERNELRLDPKPHPVAMLADLIRSRVQAQVERAGFGFELRVDPSCAAVELQVDTDALLQIMINLVDNALKFSARAECRRIEITIAPHGARRIAIAVRDHGPGVPPAMSRRIFELFVRGGNELTRETPGTGIGLALVRQLAAGMGGSVDVLARAPGAEFRLMLPH